MTIFYSLLILFVIEQYTRWDWCVDCRQCHRRAIRYSHLPTRNHPHGLSKSIKASKGYSERSKVHMRIIISMMAWCQTGDNAMIKTTISIAKYEWSWFKVTVTENFNSVPLSKQHRPVTLHWLWSNIASSILCNDVSHWLGASLESAL